jgi:pimeloyl-ACP methyl ester carboxylesterase
MSIAGGTGAHPVGEGDGPDDARLSWSECPVAGHRVRYATCGNGPDALFLHGWGLTPNAYGQAIRRMAMAGCRVYAPALPGFGGTRALAASERSFAGYSTWVGRFLDAVGVDRVALVAGHSFGGGVSTAFVHDHPGRADSLLLANAIGSPTWAALPGEVRTMVERPAWNWGRYFGTDLLASTRTLRVLPSLLEDFVPNLMRDPLGMLRTGAFIRRADLVAEVRTIAQRGVPVVVVWSDRDGLVPRSAFDDLRRAAGVEGTVVEGSHAWLIADPEVFGERALDALVDSGALTAGSDLRPA